MSTSRFCALRVNFVPMSIVSIVLEVYLGSLEVKFWSVEGEYGLWHSKLRPLEVVFRLPKNRVVPQRRGSVEHSPRGPFRFRALFYLMLLRIFQNFPFLETLALIERVVNGWVGIF